MRILAALAASSPDRSQDARFGPPPGRRRARLGRPISIADAQIAAISLEAGATLATRNSKDFDGTDVTVIDPWHAGAS